MTNLTTELKKNDKYNGFTVLNIVEITDYQSIGIWLKHDKTGMEVFHMLNTDEENLFSFGFKTIPQDSSGVAHIIEHSVLCGSKKYPLKDPFIRLVNQSVKTFLNAMTFPDKTLYPASSIVEKDYFNLMSVYGDAVFNPLLTKETFLQEGHRFEVDENNKVSVQGVVFNEMKGNYSSFESVVSEKVNQTILPGTTYSHDSGGEPCYIPELTYEQFIDFHKNFYSVSKCRLFLYGNIPTKKQIDFIVEKFLPEEVISKYSVQDSVLPQDKPLIKITKPQYIYEKGPSTKTGFSLKSEKNTVLLSFLIGENEDISKYLEFVLLSEILLGHDGSPLTQALLKSKLGQDVSLDSGISTECKYKIFTAGLRGVKKGNEKKVESVILSVLKELYEKGISKEDIDSAVMSVDFSNREIKRVSGPYSLVLMRRVYKSWFNGENPFDCIQTCQAFEEIKQNLAQDTMYVQKLIKKLFLDNMHRVLLTVIPEKNYEKQNDKKINAFIDKQIEEELHGLSKADKKTFYDRIRDNTKKLNEIQKKEEGEDLLGLLPHLKPKDLNTELDKIITQKTQIGEVPVFYHEEAVNKIVYLEIGFPCDVLDIDDLQYLPFFSIVATNCGFSGLSWTEAASKIAKLTGGLGSSLISSSVSESFYVKNHLSNTLSEKDIYEKDSITGRSWLLIKEKMLEECTEDAIRLCFDCIANSDFSDTERIKDLLIEYKNDFDESIVSNGHVYASSRAAYMETKAKTLDEIWNGLYQIYAIKELCNMDINKLIEKLNEIKQKLISSGFIINIIAEKTGFQKAQNVLEKLFEQRVISPCAPISPRIYSKKDLVKEAEINGPSTDRDIFLMPMQIGFASFAIEGSSYGTKEQVHEMVLAHYLSNIYLWEQVRVIGGAYGAFVSSDGIEKCFILSSYRDPKPYRTIEVFKEALEHFNKECIDDKALERIITGCYSKEIQPKSPSVRGSVGFLRSLYGIYDEDRERKIQYLLSTTIEDLVQAKERLIEKLSNGKSVIIFGKKDESTGKNTTLQL